MARATASSPAGEPKGTPAGPPQPSARAGPSVPPPGSVTRDYTKLWVQVVSVLGVVAVVPLLIMTAVNYRQYHQAMQEQRTRPIDRMTGNSARSLEFFFSERQSALRFVVSQMPLETLADPDELQRLLDNLAVSFGGFADIEIIDTRGTQIAYAGPLPLEGQTYADQGWFLEVGQRGMYTSEVFLGHRNAPHLVIAVRHVSGDGSPYVLRASIDTAALDQRLAGLSHEPVADAFLVDRAGVLQTPSWMFGPALTTCPLQIPRATPEPATRDLLSPEGDPLLVGFAAVEHSPFVLVLVSHEAEDPAGWLTLRRDLAVFLAISVVLILVVVVWASSMMVRKIRESDETRAAVVHHMEYDSKMAAIGRLAAGVAHEINNPLAIINERAGLMQDLMAASREMPPRDKLERQIDSIQRSVDRCSAVTHRLLGFAKHMDVHTQDIDLRVLVTETYGFLERECRHRGITVTIEDREGLPRITSDRGQLQQVFLNLLNNALAAVDDLGSISIGFEPLGDDRVAVRVADDGEGITPEDLERIFEPFFTTKGSAGTGLGLSITYGIVEKLGGTIEVESQRGVGTTFTVELPLRSPRAGEEGVG